ncbi:hypothetical protein ACIBVL_18805 [Streptomyces sp. NPDC049687]|uniref:hypothetical protein n=1 Tax=Streptomyces sp. NPDC049687 TaxID=3365596 RepID=UPI0037B3DACC
MIDWLEQAPDLPHLIARVSELVLRLGYDPEGLVVLPRGELDRRELAAYSAGWADMVAEQLPAIRRAYEERITAAYLQGQEDARTGRRPRHTRRPDGESGGEVIPLPYVELLRPPSEVTRVEERGERERSVADGGPRPTPARTSGPAPTHMSTPTPGRSNAVEAPPDSGGDEAEQPSPENSAGDILLSAREVREKRPAPSERRAVVRRNGRPSVPPLTLPGGDAGAGRDKGRKADTAERPAEEPADPSGTRAEDRPRLSDKARALAEELEGRAGRRHRDD